MRRDLIIGILVSVLLHGGFAIGGELFKDTHKKVAPKDDAPTIELIKMPEIPPDDPDIVDNEPAPDSSPIAPPSLVDVPQSIQLDSFVQQIQPPPPPNMGKPTGVITIPTGPLHGGNGRGFGEIFDIKNLDQQPVAKIRGKPAYPFDMRRQGIKGEVTVQFIVDSNGDVRDPFVVKSSQREFEASALQAVARWKWRPGRKGGRAVSTRMVVPMVFSLNDE
jgi:protein TonB